ncbi:MAG: cell division protein FtsZ [Candidatus Methanofastidiosia archaeon]
MKYSKERTRPSNTSQIWDSDVNILVVGVGGAGNNTVNRLQLRNCGKNVKTIALNTDQQHLDSIKADAKLLLGKNITKGLGTGGDVNSGKQAAISERKEIKALLEGADIIFIIAGMGGGTGSGSSPIVAEVARSIGVLSIGVFTLPFKMEGSNRRDISKRSIDALKTLVDTTIVIDNNKLLELASDKPMDSAFYVADELIADMLEELSETITTQSLINIDLADIHSIMKCGGQAMIGIGNSKGDNKCEDAVYEALTNNLFEVDYKEVKGALVHISGGPDMKLEEAINVCRIVNENIGDNKDTNIIWGARIKESLNDKMKIMLILTGVA